MKYSVLINDKPYQVEIEDLAARPVVAVVNGVRVEVTPENGNTPLVSLPAELPQKAPIMPAASTPVVSSKTLTAPLPGTVVEVFVHPGDVVESGQVALVIEAMKMKNSIRVTRSGKVAQVLAQAGQTVAHKQALLEFEER